MGSQFLSQLLNSVFFLGQFLAVQFYLFNLITVGQSNTAIENLVHISTGGNGNVHIHGSIDQVVALGGGHIHLARDYNQPILKKLLIIAAIRILFIINSSEVFASAIRIAIKRNKGSAYKSIPLIGCSGIINFCQRIQPTKCRNFNSFQRCRESNRFELTTVKCFPVNSFSVRRNDNIHK